MTVQEIVIQVKSLRAQLDVLEAHLRSSPPADGHTLADLYGVLSDEVQTSAEDIDRVLYRGPELPL